MIIGRRNLFSTVQKAKICVQRAKRPFDSELADSGTTFASEDKHKIVSRVSRAFFSKLFEGSVYN